VEAREWLFDPTILNGSKSLQPPANAERKPAERIEARVTSEQRKLIERAAVAQYRAAQGR
jgi:hypothetical protein